MQKITPHLWYDKEAKEAAEFYTLIFPNSKVTNVTQIKNTPSGDCDIVSFELMGVKFQSISAGPLFKFTPAISFIVSCTSTEEVNTLYAKLADGGMALMPLDTYPFAERYGWVRDKYGLTWQLIFIPGMPNTLFPSLMFTGDKVGKAEEAINFYTSVFKNSKQGMVSRYKPGAPNNAEGLIEYADFDLEGQKFAIMDGAGPHNFQFNEAVSLMVNCDTQEEIDYYWEKLSAVPEAEQCGWLKDKYGVSWQIVPTMMGELMGSGDSEKTKRVTEAFLKMKKFDIEGLKAA